MLLRVHPFRAGTNRPVIGRSVRCRPLCDRQASRPVVPQLADMCRGCVGGTHVSDRSVGPIGRTDGVSSDGVSVPSPRRLPVSPPTWKRTVCLGCGRRVVRVRDAWAEIGGTRSGSYLIMWGAEPLLVRITDPGRVPDEPLFLLGAAHHECLGRARARLEAGRVDLPAELPDLLVEQGPDVPRVPYTLDLPVEPDACPFCDTRTELTCEHIWPVWYSKQLQARGVTLTGDIVSHNRIEATVPVCRTCNNTWMSVLEKDAGQLIIRMTDSGMGQSPPVILTPGEQIRLATWAVKTAYLIDAFQRPVVPRGFLHELALRRIPEDCTFVWVGGYSADVAARADRRVLDFLSSNGPTRNSPNAFSVTFTISNVLFQVLGHFNGGKTYFMCNRPQYDPALFRIWPSPSGDLSWPPAFGFSRVSWDDLVASISDGRSGRITE